MIPKKSRHTTAPPLGREIGLLSWDDQRFRPIGATRDGLPAVDASVGQLCGSMISANRFRSLDLSRQAVLAAYSDVFHEIISTLSVELENRKLWKPNAPGSKVLTAQMWFIHIGKQTKSVNDNVKLGQRLDLDRWGYSCSRICCEIVRLSPNFPIEAVAYRNFRD